MNGFLWFIVYSTETGTDSRAITEKGGFRVSDPFCSRLHIRFYSSRIVRWVCLRFRPTVDGLREGVTSLSGVRPVSPVPEDFNDTNRLTRSARLHSMLGKSSQRPKGIREVQGRVIEPRVPPVTTPRCLCNPTHPSSRRRSVPFVSGDGRGRDKEDS